MESPISETDQLFFETIKEDRGWYFVKYHPPIPGYQFATLQIVVLDATKKLEDIAATMDAEFVTWLEIYPVPIMVSAFDSTGDLIKLERCRPCNHLIGYIDAKTNKVVRKWRLLANDELPKDALDSSYLRKIYTNIPFKTKQQLIAQTLKEAKQKAKQLRVGWWIVFVWAVVVPAGVAILEYWSNWLSIVVLAYSLYKAIEEALRLMGKLPKSKAEEQQDPEKNKRRHHHYHCEHNPEGFQRLKNENFERWEREKNPERSSSAKAPPHRSEARRLE